MINLRTRTEYSFNLVYGPLPLVMTAIGDSNSIGVCDRAGTWAHIEFEKACRKAGKKAIFGVEIAVVENLIQERQPAEYVAFLARSNAGLKEIYELTTESTGKENFYYTPRLDYKRLSGLTDSVAIISGSNPRFDLLPKTKNLFLGLGPASNRRSIEDCARLHKLPVIATSDNFYPRPEHRAIYEIIAGRNRDSRTTPMWILDRWEFESIHKNSNEAQARSIELAAECNAEIPKARMVKFHCDKSLEQLCREAAPARRVNLQDPIYAARLRREIDLIADKDFADYFYVIWDMLKYAKAHMLVGPARGSSCGSLVCYLLSITEIDPIPYGLLFERFIDVNRKDLPDIDIDFADDRRHFVFEYVAKKYGTDCVARLGTVMRYQAKSAIDAVAIALKIPISETENLKGAIIERSGGDARAAFCILDTFNELEIGKEMLKKYPHLRYAALLEAHAKGSGQHAAGIVITAEPISRFCSMNQRTGAVMVDKHDAEEVNFLKIDALGLRTLSVIQDCLDQIGKTREWLMEQAMEDKLAFAVINNRRFAGIFQFEGYALQSLCQQMVIENFEDIASLGALGRPGPITSGGATEFIRRRTGSAPVTYLHSLCAEMTKVTYGIIIYQEQVMEIARKMGRLTWEDVSSLRKAMSKSLGKEFFDQYWIRFVAGAKEQGVTEEDARRVWDSINSFGSWSFNRSHAVAYGKVTYWCMLLKAHHPLEWAAACLRNARDEDQCIRLLRELDEEGYKYKDFDAATSEINWSVKNGILIGGLLNLKGIGDSKAKDIMARRAAGRELSQSVQKKITAPDTPFNYDKVFELRVRFKDVLENPAKYGIASKIWRLIDITSDMEGTFLFFGKLVKRNLRDLNEPIHVAKRGGKLHPGQSLYLICTVEDNTSSIYVAMNDRNYLELGKPILDYGREGDWYLWRGYMRRGFRKVYVERYLSEAQIWARKK